jgi:hypothetical protein
MTGMPSVTGWARAGNTREGKAILGLAADRARDVIGRTYVIEALDRFITAHRQGYFFIEGGPGQGKTATAAKLIASRRLVHHFVGRTGRRSDAGVILGSLIAQLEERRCHRLLRMRHSRRSQPGSRRH